MVTYMPKKVGKDFKECLHQTVLHVMNFPARSYLFMVNVGMT